MNCKNSAQNALKVAIFRLKIEKFSGEGQCPSPDRPLPNGEGVWGAAYPLPKLHPLGAAILAPAELGHSAPSTLAPRLQILDSPLRLCVCICPRGTTFADIL